MSIIKSMMGKDQLLFDGYRYRRDKLAWRCVKSKCKGRARHDGSIYCVYQQHGCQAPDPNEIEKALFEYEIRSKAENCHDPPRLIIQNARLKLSSDAAAVVSQYTASQRIIQRIRKDKDIPIEPKTFAEIIIPPKFQCTVNGERFLLHDNNDHSKRMLIFASKEQLDLLSSCTSWHCDGTFAVSIRKKKKSSICSLIYRSLQNCLSKCTQSMVCFMERHSHWFMHYCLINNKQLMKNFSESWINKSCKSQHL